jgi:hypothetical protein
MKAKVLAATELLVPPHGFAAPHRLAMVEGVDGTHLLVMVDGELPQAGEIGVVSTDPEQRNHWAKEAK